MENKRPVALRKSSDFELLKKNGKKLKANHWLLVVYKVNNLQVVRFGCTITKKVGSAVQRNRLKRWAREYFKNGSFQMSQSAIDINLVFRPMPEDFYKKLLFKEFEASLNRVFENIK